MLSDADRQHIKDIFGADDSQVERDHLISHALAAISADLGERVMFYGGTALARSFLPDGRLSEDIDLIAVEPRAQVAEALTRSFTRRLARDFGRPQFQATRFRSQDAGPVSVVFPSGPRIQVQLLPADHYPAWPFESRELVQRYADAGPATLLLPCLDAFVAWKTVTFMDRRAPRDLWDLAALARLRPFTADAAELFTRFGPFRSPPSPLTIPAAPSEAQWRHDLAHQTQLTMTAAAARSAVVAAWAAVQHTEGDAVGRLP